VIVDGLRTPFRRYGGALREVRPDDMAAHVIRVLIERTGVESATVHDVILGAANQAGEDNRNVGRMAALLAGMPVEVPGATVNRLCGSGMNAIVNAAHAVVAGDGSVFVAGGVESMTRAPFVMAKPSAAFPRGEQTLYDTILGWRFTNPRLADAYYPFSMGETAENVVERCGVSREEQDAFALDSHRKALAAQEEGRFKAEILPVTVAGKTPITVSADESPRKDTSAESLAKLKPAFRKDGGTVTPGNAPGLNDGASAVVVASLAFAKANGLTPLARITAYATGGGDPRDLFFAPIEAVRNLMAKAGTSIGDYDLIEANEAFAVQAIADGRALGWDWDRVNVNGGAVALGHPIGASGARVLTTLVHVLQARGGGRGAASLCIGGGMGTAMIVEVARQDTGQAA